MAMQPEYNGNYTHDTSKRGEGAMKTSGMTTFAIIIMNTFVYSSTTSAGRPAPGTCNVTCYEQTPSCYVTKDSSGCLVISDKKPKPVKGAYVCELKSCVKKTTY
jgi:hypothetical protein